MFEDEIVRRRKWLTHDELLDYLGAVNLIPGPNSTELAIHVGYLRAGWPGLLVAGACFIFPAALIVTVLAWLYVRFGTIPAATGVLSGIKPVVIAIILQALWRLGRAALKSPALGLLGAGAVVASALGVHELVVLGAAGLFAALAARGGRPALTALWPIGGWMSDLTPRSVRVGAGRAAGAGALGLAAGALPGAAPFSLWALFAVFLKIGSVLFGSGYVLLAFLRADLVERLGWLSERQLLDAVAVGQVTPGPVFTTATFIGYVLGGGAGALVATVGIFLPAFIFVALSGHLVPRLRRSPVAGAVLDGVNVASLALMAVVTWQLGRAALVDVPSAALAVLSLVLLTRLRINSAWLVLGGAVVGLASRSLRG